MVGDIRVVALLYSPQVGLQFALVQTEVLDQAGLLEDVQGENGQSVTGRSIS